MAFSLSFEMGSDGRIGVHTAPTVGTSAPAGNNVVELRVADLAADPSTAHLTAADVRNALDKLIDQARVRLPQPSSAV